MNKSLSALIVKPYCRVIHIYNFVNALYYLIYKKILCFKNTFKTDITTMEMFLKNDNIPCNYISNYIIKRLENEYPNEIAILDNLIDELYFKQAKLSSSKISDSKNITDEELNSDIVFVHKD